MGIKKLNLGLLKIEHHKVQQKSSPKFIKIEKVAEPYRPNIESNINISVLPKSMEHLTQKEKTVQPKLKKPKKFAKRLNEIKLLLNNIIMFESLLTTMILFLSFYMIFIVIKITAWYAVFVPLIYLFIYLFLKLRKNKYLEVEKKFPELNEKIRSAADSIYTSNPVVDELRQEVSHELKRVDYGSFFGEKKNSYKVLFIILLCFGVILLAKYDVSFDLNLQQKIEGIFIGEDGEASGTLGELMSAVTGGKDDNIYGEELLTELGDEEISIQMEQVGFEVNMDDVKPPSEREFEQSLFPPDAGLENAEVYGKNILKEHKELVKNYFKNMAEN